MEIKYIYQKEDLVIGWLAWKEKLDNWWILIWFSRVGNTGVPGVWLFHTGKRFSFQEIIPASIGGLLAVPPTAGYGLYLVIIVCCAIQRLALPSHRSEDFTCFLSKDTTTPEYEFDDYNFEPESQEEVDAAGSPDSPNTRSEDSDRQLSYNREDVPLTLEPVERQYAPPGFPLTVPEGRTQRVEEQQPQVANVSLSCCSKLPLILFFI